MRSLSKILRYILFPLKLSNYLHFIERIILSFNHYSDKPQIFILGLPRSGTTLIYQYIVHRLEVAYFTNGVGQFYLSPCLVTFLQNKIYGKYISNFQSNYGKVVGPLSPREAGGVWGRFFDLEIYTDYLDVNTQDINKLQKTVSCIQRIFGNKPFVNKNVKHMLRIDALKKIFPNSYFLVVDRELKDVALSTIRGRYKNLKNPKGWWSVKPLNYEDLKNLSVPEQVAYQLITLKNKMETDFSELPPQRVLRVRYEHFCNDPEYLIRKLKTIIPVVYKNTAHPLFDQSTNKINTKEEKELIEILVSLNAGTR